MKNKFINTVIVLGSHVAHIISIGMCISFGILYSEIRNDFHISHSKASWVASLFNGLVGLAGLPLGFLSPKFGERKLTIIGTLLLCTGMITSRFVSQFQLLYLTYGLIAGTGAGIIHYCANTVIVRHFVAKWRPLAIVLANSGSSVSSLIWPPIMTSCIERFGWQTTFTALGGCCAVGLMSAATFVAPFSNTSDGKTDTECPSIGEPSGGSSFMIVKRILQNADFMIFFTSSFVTFTVVFVPSTILPDLMLEQQVERTKISLCVMVTGIGNLIGRLAGGFVSCKYHRRVAMIHGITLFGFGITSVCISFAESLEAFAILSTMIGVFSGGYCLHMAVVSHYLDAVCLPVGFGLIVAANGISSIAGIPLAGLVSDRFDTSRGAFIFSGIVMLLATSIHGLTAIKHFLRKRKQKTKICEQTNISIDISSVSD